jgi:hypothetical protein
MREEGSRHEALTNVARSDGKERRRSCYHRYGDVLLPCHSFKRYSITCNSDLTPQQLYPMSNSVITQI